MKAQLVVDTSRRFGGLHQSQAAGSNTSTSVAYIERQLKQAAKVAQWIKSDNISAATCFWATYSLALRYGRDCKLPRRRFCSPSFTLRRTSSWTGRCRIGSVRRQARKSVTTRFGSIDSAVRMAFESNAGPWRRQQRQILYIKNKYMCEIVFVICLWSFGSKMFIPPRTRTLALPPPMGSSHKGCL